MQKLLNEKTLLVDKPEGWTSFDVVAKIRGKIRASYIEKREKPTKKQLKVGHAGTLDPFATGLLVILLGDECKNADMYLKKDKTYEFTAKLGEGSSTGDTEGEITTISDAIPTLKQVKVALKQFEGVISQVPPAFSAIKIGGKRAYKLAREGKEVTIPAREVRINRIELDSYEYPYLKCVCDVSSGTYIRTLVEDIGKNLATGAYCYQLRRTKIDKFDIKDAKTVEDLSF